MPAVPARMIIAPVIDGGVTADAGGIPGPVEPLPSVDGAGANCADASWSFASLTLLRRTARVPERLDRPASLPTPTPGDSAWAVVEEALASALARDRASLPHAMATPTALTAATT
jgi:hypothetical protein